MSRLLVALHQLDGGGVSRVTADLAAGLAARGHDVTLALVRRGGPLAPPPGVRLAELDGPRLPGGAGLLAAAPALARLVERERPDWLVAPGNRMHLSALAAHRIAGRRGVRPRLALKYTNPVERVRPGAVPNALRRALFARAAARADRLLFLSDAARDCAAALAGPNSHASLVTVANPYVDDAVAAAGAAAPRPAAEGTPPLLLSVGRLVAQKDHALMLDALSGLRARPWRLVVLGEGPRRAALVARARELGLSDRVHFAGYGDPARYLPSAALFLLSSAYEELPAVLFEALAAGVPIVSTRASQAIADLFEGEALLTEPEDVEAFRAAVSRALDSPPRATGAAALLARHSRSSGVASHAEALGL